MTRASELRALSTEELRARLERTRREHLELRFKFATGQLGKPDSLRKVRREVARILTLLRERELAGEGEG